MRRPLQAEHQAELLAGPGRHLRRRHPTQINGLGEWARKDGIHLGSAKFERTNGHRDRLLALNSGYLRCFALKARILGLTRN